MKKYIIVICIVALSIITYLFLFGKLFPYSPIILGFEKHELLHTIIYVQNGTDYQDWAKIDTFISAVEQFHEMKFKVKPELFIFRDSSEYLNHSISKARFCAFTSGRLIIAPWALKEAEMGTISLETYLKHELSHILIFQYKGILDSFNYPDWLLEGIAVYSTNQMGTSFYPSKNETYKAIKQGNFMPPFNFKTKYEDQIKLDVKYRITFMYSEFACIVDYLISNYGKEKFLLYTKSLLENNNHSEIFKRVYGIDFDKFLFEFKKHTE